MPGRVRDISGDDVQLLSGGWEIAASEAGAFASPADVARERLAWTPTVVPSTAAAALRAAGAWSLDGAARRFDAEDWWYRVRFNAPKVAGGAQAWLCFDGLATIADVWLNGQPLLASASMFTAHERRVDAVLRDDNELLIRFRSLDGALRERRPRPRWRAPMVENQQIRWFRTTLLGRTPGWSPPAQPVGPWRAVRLEVRRSVSVGALSLRAGADGRLTLSCAASDMQGRPVKGAEIVLSRDGREYRAPCSPAGDGTLAGQLVVPNAQKWWPHTHGDPALYAASLRFDGGAVADLGAIGFRSVGVNTADDGFAVYVNRAPVFCRGACWTPLDPVALTASPDALDQAFAQVVRSGMNMLRVGGMMVYEEDAFLDRCDAHGVLLWQDFMFANMEYPAEDGEFLARVSDEAAQQLARLQGRPSVAVLCGNSEAEQQASMWGASRDRWHQALFHEHLSGMARQLLPDVPYWPSSAHGGAFPHQGNSGTASYYGVGAYLRPLEDARRAEVRFASECLAFANIPEPRAFKDLPGGPDTKVHYASWKARTPRDLGAGWDFDDVRDHYVADLFKIDLLQLRYADHERYLALGRVATGEVMAHVFGEWRRRRSRTQGGLIWFLRDLWPGAGWGVIDASGHPKAAWHYLRRALAPIALFLSDEGGNGVGVHVVNDLATPLRASLSLSLFRFGEVRVAHGERSVEIEARSALELNGATFFEDFVDLSWAYRFGPPSHNVIVATLKSPDGAELARAFHFVPALPNGREMDVGLHAEILPGAEGAFDLLVRTRRLAQSVSVDIDGFECEDNYFHLAPGDERRLALRRCGDGPGAQAPRGTVRALNSETAATASVARPA